MQVTIEHLSGSKQGQLEQVDGERITFGRNPTNKVSFDPQKDVDVSGDHAQLVLEDDGKYHLVDLGSRNGTFLNGTQVQGAAPVMVEPGSLIQFGKNTGPKVRVVYTPGPRKDQIALGQLQQQMQTEREAAAKKQKKLLIGGGIAAAILLTLGIIWGVVSGKAAKRRDAEAAEQQALDDGAMAKTKKADTLAAAEFQMAMQAETAAKKAYTEGNYEVAKAKFAEARKLYRQALVKADEEREAKRERELAAARDAARVESERIAAEMRKQQEEYARQRAEQEKKDRLAKQELIRRMEKADAAAKKKLADELAKLKQKLDNERMMEITNASEPSICYVKVQSYVQPKDSEARTVIHETEGTGFALGKDLVVTAKHVVLPWLYEPKVLALATKWKQEQGLDVKQHIEVYTTKAVGQPFEKQGDSASGVDVVKVAPHKRSTEGQTVKIEWNLQEVEMPDIKVHEKTVNDIAFLSVPGASLTPLGLAEGTVGKLEPMFTLGTVRDTAPPHAIKPSPVRGDVQQADPGSFSINITVPPIFSGAPLFKGDGNVWGVVAGTEGSNLICLPIEQIKALMNQEDK